MARKRAPAVRKARQNQKEEAEDVKTAPHSFVIHHGKVGQYVRRLVRDTRKIMEPYTATKLQVRKRNVLRDYIAVAGPLNVTHLCCFTKTEVSVNLRIIRLPRGPTMTFKVHSYCLSSDVVSSIKCPSVNPKQYKHYPLLVMNGFSGDGLHLKLMSTMFQNMFPSINVNKTRLNMIKRCVLLNYNPETKMVDLRHYNVHVVPVGVGRVVRKLIKSKVPKLGKYSDISEYVMKGNLSESEAEMDGPQNEIILPQFMSGRGNRKAAKSAIRLTELGPRMCLELEKIQEGISAGEVLYHSFIKKSKEEIEAVKMNRHNKRKLKEQRKREQLKNVQHKVQLKEEHKRKSLKGMKAKQKMSQENEDEMDENEDDDKEYYRKEVGAEPDPELFSAETRRRKREIASNIPLKKTKLDHAAARRSKKESYVGAMNGMRTKKKAWNRSQHTKQKTLTIKRKKPNFNPRKKRGGKKE